MTRIDELKRDLRALAKRKGHTLGPFSAGEHEHPWGKPFKLPSINNTTTYGARCKTCNVLVIVNEDSSWTARNDRALSQRCLTAKNLHYSKYKEKSRESSQRGT